MPDRSANAAAPTLAGPPRPEAFTMVQPSGPPTTATPAPLVALKTDRVSRIGEYEIQEKLGEGGMGAVYRGFDTQLRRSVAIKVLLPEYTANREARERFLREARSAASISHDNVVSIHHVGDHNGAAYLVMPLLKGMSLETFFQKKGLPTITQSVRIAREIAAGLAAAHRQGFIHRDVKPANVWLESPNGRVKLLDFGIAKPAASAQQSAITEAGVVMGTPAFMSPEQARGYAVDSRSDLFSLGAILYRLVAGVPPFSRPSVMETLTALVSESPVPVQVRNPATPPILADLIHRLLARDPAGRPDSADAVIKELRQIERGDADERKATGIIAASAAMRISGEMPTIAPDPGFEIVEDVPEVTRKTGRRKKRRNRRAGFNGWTAVVAASCVAAVAVIALVVAGIVKSVGRNATAPEKPAADVSKLTPADGAAKDGKLTNGAPGDEMPERPKFEPEYRPAPPQFPPPPGAGMGPRPPFGKRPPPPPHDRP